MIYYRTFGSGKEKKIMKIGLKKIEQMTEMEQETSIGKVVLAKSIKIKRFKPWLLLLI